jgi:(2Fe-2S) ferredoxin
LLRRILDEHLRGGKPVSEAVFHRLGGPSAPTSFCSAGGSTAQ